MAPPDLNTLPQSSPNSSSPTLPQRTTQSRRASNMMTGRPSQSDEGDVPIRHPRPLTTAELHLEMEQEQEAAVNRLARELSALRAQHSASTASNASSSATSAIDPQTQTQHQLQHVPGQMTPPRHRSPSSLSTRGQHSTLHGTTALASQASVDRARDAAGMRSRENSLASGTGIGAGGVTMPVSRSRPPSASPSPSLQDQDPHTQQGWTAGGGIRQRRGSSSTSTSRWEEAERARVQLEIARKENEMLAARVRELEGLLRENERGRARDGKGEGKGEVG